MRILYSVCSWGLGHATRSLPVIRKLIDENNKITIVSHDRALELLKKEIGDRASYYDIPDYPVVISDDPLKFLAKTSIYWPLFIHRLRKGLTTVTKMLKNEKYDLIISDGRYDSYSKKIPSFFITHQIRILHPLGIKFFERGSELFNLFFFRRFAGVLVPDYKDKNNLSGDLSHNLNRIDEDKLYYIGALSDFKRKEKSKDIDYLISITGPEPQRSLLEDILLSQADELKGKVVMTLGKTEKKKKIRKGCVEVYSYLTKEEREDILNRSKLVISRSGYSTILDLAVIGNKALLIPTPGQTEQDYLARYHKMKKTFYSVSQNEVDLKRDVELARRNTGINWNCDVDRSVENILNVITSVKKSPFA